MSFNGINVYKFQYHITIFCCHLISILLIIFSFSAPLSAQGIKTLSISECIDIAVENNPQIGSARENLDKTRLGIKDARSSMLPTLSSNIGYSRIEDEDFMMTPEDNYSLSVELQQPIYNQGKYSTLKKQADINIDISDLELNYVMQRILFNVISAYISTLKDEELINIALESRDRLAEHLRVTMHRFEVGDVAKNDVLRAEMEIANAESDLIHAQKALSSSHEALQKLLLMEEKPFKTKSFTLNWDQNIQIDELVNSAYNNRPDYKQAIRKRMLAETGITLAKKDFLPFVSLFAEFNRTGDEFLPEYDTEVIGCNINIPIFEAGSKQIRLQRSRHDLSLASYQLIDLKRQIKMDVTDALLHIEDLKAKLKALDKQIEHAQENLRIVQLRYKEGVGTNLDVLDANLILVKAKTDFSTYNYDLILAKFNLLKQLGDLGTERVKDLIVTN